MASQRLIVSVLLAAALGASAAHAGSFESYHPDQYYRSLGEEAWRAQRYDEAHSRFVAAARYADKNSQLALATMYWKGEGVAADRATAYAWADLAAERGYPDFLTVRESYWAGLSPSEQERAIEVGTALYAEYGDDVAKRRLASLLRRGLAQKTGTRTGSEVYELGVASFDGAARGFLAARIAGAGGKFTLPVLASAAYGAAAMSPSSGYYSAFNWKPEQYWQLQDAPWLPSGEVTVGPLRPQDAGPKRD